MKIQRLPVIGERGSLRATVFCGGSRGQTILRGLVVGAALALAAVFGWFIGGAPR